jgi:hypothetical protein
LRNKYNESDGGVQVTEILELLSVEAELVAVVIEVVLDEGPLPTPMRDLIGFELLN